MHHLLRAAGITRTKNGKRYDKAANYGFRKRFNGLLKMNNNVNSNIAEKLMAHKRGLDGSYLKPTREECFAEFKKAIIDLTVDDSERLKIQSKTMDHIINKMQSEKGERIAFLEKEVAEMRKGWQDHVKVNFTEDVEVSNVHDQGIYFAVRLMPPQNRL